MPKEKDLKALSVTDLVEMEKKIQRELGMRHEEKIGLFFAETKARMAELNVTEEELIKGIAKYAKGPVAPKYQNPDNPDEVWAGRGLKPKWMVKKLNDGAKLKDLEIKKQS